MKDIKIFIGSSAELEEDRRQFDNYFSDKNKIYLQRYICFNQRTWKDFRSSVTQGRLQDRYNAYIRTCDIAIFLFHTKIGKYTKEEFELAYSTFLKNGKKPLVYVFLKEDSNVTDPELADFKKKCEAKLGHFCDTYTDYSDLLSKFDRQLQILENEGVIKPDPIDVRKIVKYGVLYFILPLLLLLSAFFAIRYYSPIDMTVRLLEDSVHAVPGLPFTSGRLTVGYADANVQEFAVSDEFNEVTIRGIHSKYKGEKAHVEFTAGGYEKIDTLVPISKLVSLSIRRDNSLGVLFGNVIDEAGRSLSGVLVTVGDMSVLSDAAGNFRVEIPYAKQKEEQRVSAVKDGYRRWDFTAPVSSDIPWNIVLKK